LPCNSAVYALVWLKVVDINNDFLSLNYRLSHCSTYLSVLWIDSWVGYFCVWWQFVGMQATIWIQWIPFHFLGLLQQMDYTCSAYLFFFYLWFRKSISSKVAHNSWLEMLKKVNVRLIFIKWNVDRFKIFKYITNVE
jgi:hypothetical protein